MSNDKIGITSGELQQERIDAWNHGFKTGNEYRGENTIEYKSFADETYEERLSFFKKTKAYNSSKDHYRLIAQKWWEGCRAGRTCYDTEIKIDDAIHSARILAKRKDISFEAALILVTHVSKENRD